MLGQCSDLNREATCVESEEVADVDGWTDNVLSASAGGSVNSECTEIGVKNNSQ